MVTDCTTFMLLWLPSLRMESRQREKAKEKQSSDRQDETNREAPKLTQCFEQHKKVREQKIRRLVQPDLPVPG